MAKFRPALPPPMMPIPTSSIDMATLTELFDFVQIGMLAYPFRRGRPGAHKGRPYKSHGESRQRGVLRKPM